VAEFLRIAGGVVQTAVRGFVHPDSGRRVTLVGVAAAGEPDYYTQLRRLVTDLQADGACVHSEASDLDAARMPADVRAEERVVLHELTRRHEHAVARVGQVFGWVDRACALPVAEGWRVTDLHVVEVLRLSATAARHHVGRLTRGTDPSSQDPRMVCWFALVTVLLLRAHASNSRLLHRALTRRAGGPIRQRRTWIALYEVDQEPAGQDVVLLWNAQGLPDIAAGLTTRGFQPDEPIWLWVGHLPTVGAILHALSDPQTPEPTPQ